MSAPAKILFVDDEEGIRLTFPAVLQAHGFQVTTASTVAEALALIVQYKFDVLIADLNINGIGDGFTVISAMHSAQPAALRLILTGYPAFENALEAIRHQVHDYVIKPTDTEVLVEKIRAGLASAPPLSPAIERKRLADIIRENQEAITASWLRLSKDDREIGAIPITDDERKNHLSSLLNLTVLIADGKAVRAENMGVAAEHGAIRHSQGYTIPLLVREARFLIEALGECIQQKLLRIEISHLVPDMMRVFQAIQILSEEATRAFTQQSASKRKRST